MRKRNKIMSLCLAAAVSIGMLGGLAPKDVNASMPTSSAGQVYDGVNFTELSKQGNYFYYGEYQHALTLFLGDRGPVTSTEAIATPVLWRIMGEEGTDGNITALSEYVLDTSEFDRGSPGSGTSTMKSKLNDAGGIIDAFSIAEKNNLKLADIITTRFWSDRLVVEESSILYLPSMVHYSHPNDITWYGKADASVTSYLGDTSSNLDSNKATLKNGQPTRWWLRTQGPGSHEAVEVLSSGELEQWPSIEICGVRPILKLNPSSVIFTSEIKNGADASKGETVADANYVTASAVGTKNYKLTIEGNDDSNALGTTLADKTTTNENSFQLNGLAPTKTTIDGDYTINYKIVGTTTNGREILKYGTTEALTETTLSMDTAGLEVGEYTAYVWLQKNNATTSHEGYDVQSFALTVSPQAPVIPPTDKATVAEGKASGEAGRVLPNTGDNRNMILHSSLLLLAGAGIFLTIVRKRKQV